VTASIKAVLISILLSGSKHQMLLGFKSVTQSDWKRWSLSVLLITSGGLVCFVCGVISRPWLAERLIPAGNSTSVELGLVQCQVSTPDAAAIVVPLTKALDPISLQTLLASGNMKLRYGFVA